MNQPQKQTLDSRQDVSNILIGCDDLEVLDKVVFFLPAPSGFRVRHGDRFEHYSWQLGRGHDRNIIKGRTRLKMISDTTQNSIPRRLVEQAKDSKWCSAAWYEKTSPDE